MVEFHVCVVVLLAVTSYINLLQTINNLKPSFGPMWIIRCINKKKYDEFWKVGGDF